MFRDIGRIRRPVKPLDEYFPHSQYNFNIQTEIISLYCHIPFMVEVPDPTPKAELQSALYDTVRRAYLNGVKVADCGYPLLHGNSDIPD